MKRKLNQLPEFNYPDMYLSVQTKAVKRTIFTMNIEEPAPSKNKQTNQPMFGMASQKPNNQNGMNKSEEDNTCVFQTGTSQRIYLNQKQIHRFSDMFES